MKNLIWKQWQESKTLLYIFTAWMLISVAVVIGDRTSHTYAEGLTALNAFAFLYIFFAAIVLACQAAHGERVARTLSFTRSLPIPIKHIATTKIIGAILTLSIPILIAFLMLAIAVYSGKYERIAEASPNMDVISNGGVGLVNLSSTPPTFLNLITNVTAITIVCGVQLMLLLSLLGCYLRSHVQVGLIGPILVVVIAIFSGMNWKALSTWPLGMTLYGSLFPLSLLTYGGPTAQVSYLDQSQLIQYRWIAIVLSLPVLVAIAYGYVCKFGKDQRKRSSQIWLGNPSLPITVGLASQPISKQWISLTWLELRQTLPLVFYGLILAITTTLLAHFTASPIQRNVDSLAQVFTAIVIVTGALWSIVVGSGIFSTDNTSSLGRFRRSRPIPHRQWFWIKFFVGLAAVLILLDGASILFSWNAHQANLRLGLAYVACFPLLHAFLYALSVLGTCVFKKPLIGSFVAVLCFIAVCLVLSVIPFTRDFDILSVFFNLQKSEQKGTINLIEHGYPIIYGLMAVATIACSYYASHFARSNDPAVKWFEKVPG